MEYRFSEVLDPDQLTTHGLCDGMPVRKHVAADLEEIGTFRAQQDWSRLVEPLSNYKGGLGPSHSFMAVSLPECIPERFETVSYANEFAFLYDDATDTSRQELTDTENTDLLEGFSGDVGTERTDKKSSGKRQMQATILTAMLQLDRERAMAAIKAWSAFVEQGCGSQHHTSFRTLAEYLPYRCKDVGHMFWHALVTFGCALTIPENELAICEELVLPAVVAASLTNDLYSYEKEFRDAQRAGNDHVTNGLWVLMIEHGISLEEAKTRCRDRIKEEVAKYVQVVQDVNSRSDLSTDTKKYIEVMQYSVSGNVVWSIQCPRYHATAVYNERQQLRMEFGVENYPTTYIFDEILTTPTMVVESEQCDLLSGREEIIVDIIRESSASSTVVADGGHVWEVSDMTKLKSPPLSSKVTLQPFDYICALPSKGVRDMAIEALNFWLEVPPLPKKTIKSMINRLHTASLMLDDLQDCSQLRRGEPSTHTIFGPGQTINSATFQYVEALAQVRGLNNPQCLQIFVEEVKALFVGQSYDLNWIWEQKCPSVSEYLQMVDGKTGSMFRLLTKLMVAESTRGEQAADLGQLCLLLGRYFQIRDDYQNLESKDYHSQKGSFEDLDEGKYSLPLIHTLNHSVHAHVIRDLLSQRRVAGRMTMEQKRLIVRCMSDAGSLEFTLQVLRALYRELEAEVDRLEGDLAKPNFQLRLVLSMLKV